MWFFCIAIAVAVVTAVLIINNKSQSKSQRNYTYHRRNYPPLFVRSAEENGRIGEGLVILELGGTHEGEQYVFNDYTIEANGTTSQIDHIFINSHGVFVIETKNYSGQIYGEDNWHEWTQVLQYGKVKKKFYNPVKQNATHVYHLREIIKNRPVHSVVVLAQNNTENIKSEVAIPLNKLKQVVNTGPEVLTPEDMKDIFDVLREKRTFVSKGEHVSNINKMQQDIANNICPRCSGKLVLKNGKYGDFWGCENYPKCKFVKNIKK